MKKIKPGSKVRVRENAFVDPEYKGKIGKVSAIDFDELEVKMRDGSVVYVTFEEVERA